MNLQPSLGLVQLISEDHDIEVQFWKDEVESLIDTSSATKMGDSVVSSLILK